jgi:signal transduction histidine kinase
MNSINRQLSLGLVGSLMLVGLLIAQVALWLFDNALRGVLAHELELSADRVLAAIERNGDDLQLVSAHLDDAYRRPLSGRYFLVQARDRQWRSRSLWDSELNVPTAPGLATGLQPGPQQQQLLLWRADVERHGRPLTIVVAHDYAATRAEFRAMAWALLTLWCLALLALLALQRIWVTRALRPLESARRQIEQLQTGERLRLDTDAPRELQPLIREVNRLLDHTDRLLQRSRDAVGNLGHALKTPLGVLSNLAERECIRADVELHTQMRDNLAVINDRISRELSRARLAGEVLPGQRFLIETDLPLLIESVRRAQLRPVTINYTVTGSIAAKGALPYERDDLLEILGNLLDNACKWAQGNVTLSLQQSAGELEICVEDDGPGIDEAMRDTVLRRGARLDESVSGHGLGLAIVADAVAVYDGSLQLLDADRGGLKVVVRLPCERTTENDETKP